MDALVALMESFAEVVCPGTPDETGEYTEVTGVFSRYWLWWWV